MKKLKLKRLSIIFFYRTRIRVMYYYIKKEKGGKNPTLDHIELNIL